MKLVHSPVEDDGARTFFITNISPSEAKDLREALKNICSVRHYLPLVNKVFIEFESVHDADQFGTWYSLLEQAPRYQVYRLKGPKSEQLFAASNLEKYLDEAKMMGFLSFSRRKEKFIELAKRQLLITGLPSFYEGRYTEEDVAKLLVPFGFQYRDDTIYVVPQTCMAFIVMPTEENVHRIIHNISTEGGIYFQESRLCFHEVTNSFLMTPFSFYETLMNLMEFPVEDDGSKVIFINNISQSEARDLREALKKVSSVKTYLPLLNKIFIEFESDPDADRLGVWFSLLKEAPGYKVHRLKRPYSLCDSDPPKHPESALPDSKDAVAGVIIPVDFGVPQGSIAPFWVTMRTSPFVFPTTSPWFIIPKYLTVREMDDIEKARCSFSSCPTIMLTGLPRTNYKHEDVAKLVSWSFPKQDLHSLYYFVTVLPLQRRAFVYFTDWNTCTDFVRDHVQKPVSVEDCKISVHFVQDMTPASTEEMMYKTLMKLSNAVSHQSFA
ncbi:uncharacterized protein ABDE67_020492 [Symphorus nematophorus]